MLGLTEKQMLIQALGQVVFDEIQTAIKPFSDRVTRVEKVISDMPVPRDGRDGKDADSDELRRYIDQRFVDARDFAATMKHDACEWTREYVGGAIDALPKPERGEPGARGEQGLRGERGEPGEKGERGERGETGERGEKGEPGERGKDGVNGVNGVDGASIRMDDVRAYLADVVAKTVGDIPRPRNCVGGFIDRRGNLFLSFSDGSNSDLGPVVGRDGASCDMAAVHAQISEIVAAIEKPRDGRDGKDGMDGVGFDDMEMEYNGDRLVVFKFVKGENAKTFNLQFPIPLFRGIWEPNEYEKSDIVQRDGSMWIALRTTTAEPGKNNSDDWRLCAMRGREGKPGKPGEPGKPGADGRPGRDLTQLGPDGSKW